MKVECQIECHCQHPVSNFCFTMLLALYNFYKGKSYQTVIHKKILYVHFYENMSNKNKKQKQHGYVILNVNIDLAKIC